MPTSWVKNPMSIEGMQLLDISNRKTMSKVTALCKRQQITPPSGFSKSNSFHYGKYNGKKLVSFLSVCSVNLNRMPGSIAVIIDIAASVDKAHSMTIAVNSMKKILRKRRNPCLIYAQVAQTKTARDFWKGKLTCTKRASVLPALLQAFDPRYMIYGDVDDMAIFYE